MPIVQRPLAAVIARGDGAVHSPRDLEGHTVGVTGLPSDEAVVDSEVSADGGDPNKVDEVTIGFNAVSSLAAGKVDAATGFWNAEGVELRRQGSPDPDLQSRPLRRPALPRAGPDHLPPGRSTATRPGRSRRRRDPPRLRVRRAEPGQGARRPPGGRPDPRTRRPAGPARRPPPRPAPRPLRPRRAARMVGLGPRARPAETPARRRRRLRAEELAQSRGAARRAAAVRGTCASAAPRGRCPPPRRRLAGLDVDVRVVAEHRARRVAASASGSATSRSATIRSASSSGASANEPRPETTWWPAAVSAPSTRLAEHQVGGDADDAGH